MAEISVIIPTLNEVSTIRKTLEDLVRKPGLEIFVTDGGSLDGTVEIAGEFDVTVLQGSAGRGRQMNSGAQAASSPILVFLHADTALPQDWQHLVRETLKRPGVVAGAFRFKIEGSGWGIRLIEWMTNLRSKYLQTPYGDQVIFVRSDLFREIGGYPDTPIMEDFELVRRLTRRGRIAIAPADARTSGRRWKKLGLIRTTLVNWLVVVAYSVGFSHETLARWYGRERKVEFGRRKSERGNRHTRGG